MVTRYDVVDLVARHGKGLVCKSIGDEATVVGQRWASRRAVCIDGDRLRELGPEGRASMASAVAQGQIFGSIEGQACRLESEHAVSLPGLGGESSGVLGAAGEHVVGWSDTDRWDTYEAGTESEHRSPRRAAVRWSAGEATALPTLGGWNALAHAVNRRGEAAGRSEAVPQGSQVPCAWPASAATARPVGLDDVAHGPANAINEQGVVVGGAWLQDDRYLPFVCRDGEVRLIDVGVSGVAYDLDERGRIVGTAERTGDDGRRRRYGWIFEDGEVRDLDALVEGGPWAITHAHGITEAGVILATVRGPSHAVLLMPR